MAVSTIITVGRQYGSGGRYVARLLAEKLGIPFYDKELLAEVAKDSGFNEDLLQEHDEKNTRNFLFSMMGGQSMGDAGSMYLDSPDCRGGSLCHRGTLRGLCAAGSAQCSECFYQGGQGRKDPPDREILRGGCSSGRRDDQKER